MHEMPLLFQAGHLFCLDGDGRKWLLDTGSPQSFGNVKSFKIGRESFRIAASLGPVDANQVSALLGETVAGLIGVDVLNKFDLLIDVPAARLSFTKEEIDLAGEVVSMEASMGIPTVQVQVAGDSRRMFIDTGAQVSYLRQDLVDGFPAAGRITDFYPGIGRFDTETYRVAITLGTLPLTLRCGVLPDTLGLMLKQLGGEGVIGNEFLQSPRTGYFPRRKRLVLSH